MNNGTELQIHELINLSLDGTITSTEFGELSRLIKSDSECATFYVSSIKIHRAFSRAGCLFREHAGKTLSDSMREFAEYEKTAPAVQIAKAEVQSEQEQDALSMVPVRKISKLPMMMVIASCAALLMMFVYVYLNPQMTEVATLTDSINPKWVGPEGSLQVGSRLLTTRKPVALKEGIIKILYDNDVEVLIEAPAEYQIQSSNEIALHSGRLFAKVSPAGRGFAVKTNNTRIVDLGTEFGVYSDLQNKTELHVFKGKTTLTSTADKTAKNLGVISGQARKVDAAGNVRDIQLNKDVFVRAIDSKTNLVWRGQKLDLADMVRNGNGLGTGNSAVRLDPLKGFTTDQHFGFSTAKGFLPLPGHSFIDGIFIPDGKTVVSSRGDVKAFPETGGVYYFDLLANPAPGLFYINAKGYTVHFDGQEYSDQGKSCIVMHGNHGITFDLDAIRRGYPCRIDRFTSRVGIVDFRDNSNTADFYVLVDGQPRYSLLQYAQKGVLNNVSVKIEDTDRFLTLVTINAEGGGKPGRDSSKPAGEWCVFTEPVLKLE
jgi:hypothetical protein